MKTTSVIALLLSVVTADQVKGELGHAPTGERPLAQLAQLDARTNARLNALGVMKIVASAESTVENTYDESKGGCRRSKDGGFNPKMETPHGSLGSSEECNQKCNEDADCVAAFSRSGKQCYTFKQDPSNKSIEYKGNGWKGWQCFTKTGTTGAPLACQKKNCSDYRGKMNTTVSGKKCQAWTADTPHTTHDYKPADKPGMGLEDGAYCRNPDNEEHVWCFTMDKSETWEICPDPLKVEVAEPEIEEISTAMPMPMPTGGIPCPIAKINMTKAQTYLKSTTTSFNAAEAHTQAAEAAFKAKMAMANGLYAKRSGAAKAKFAAAQAAYATAQAAAQAVYDASRKTSAGFEATFITINTEYESASMHMDEMSMKLQMGEASVMTCIPMHPPVDRRACMQAGRELEAITVKNAYEQTEVKYRIETRDYYLRGYQAYRAKGWQGLAGQFYRNYSKWAANANEQIVVLQKSEIAMEEATLKKEKVCDEGTTGAPPPTADMFGPFGPPPRRG